MSSTAQDQPWISSDERVPLQAIISTDELSRRPSRPADYEAENGALAGLMQELSNSSAVVLHKLADTALSLCRAHSAGISILEQEGGRKVLRWHAVAGRWAGLRGSTIPYEASPCCTVLDRNHALLLSRPDRHYLSLREFAPPPVEMLAIPFHTAAEPVGTIWVMTHEEDRKFDLEDLRLLTSLARFASAAQQVVRSHERLREGERHFRELMDALPAAIYTTDAEGRLTYVNPAAIEFFGREPELGRDHWWVGSKFYQPDGTPLPHQECPMAIMLKEGRSVCGVEIIAERPDGKRTWITPYPQPLRDAAGRLIGGVNMLLDVTGNQRTREVQARLAAIVNSSDDAIVGKTLEGVITSWNRGAERIFGYTAAEAVGQHISLVIPPERLAEEETVLERLRRGETIEHFETERQAKDGRRVQVSLAVSPIRDSSGRVIGASKVARDITERRRAEQQLRQTQKLESIGVLAGGIAHDFNNLLTGIMGNASLAQETLPPAHPARPLLDDVLRASQSAAELTRQMLAYAGRAPFILKSIDLSALVRDITSLIQSSIHRTVQLRLELDDQLPRIEADETQLQQLIMNLVINGAEAIGEGEIGTVRVTTAVKNVDDAYLRQTFRQPQIAPGRHVLLQVQDDGCGMDEETKARIFDPFFSTKFTGRGLGLAAALGIVRGHKGAIVVSSTPREGSTFQVLFPVVERAAEKETLAVRGAAALWGKGTILVVDDEEIVRHTAEATLARYGYAVLLAANGQEAVDLFRVLRDRISLVLLDLTMPVMSGEETLQKLKAIRPGVPVILSSGYNRQEAVRRFQSKNLAGFIQKPYTAAELAEQVRSVLA